MVCGAIGIGMAMIGMGALFTFATLDKSAADKVENRIYHAKVEAGEIMENPHKRTPSKFAETKREEK